MKLKEENMTILTASEVDPNLLKMLDRGIEDIKNNRTMTHKDAIEEIHRIRATRKGDKRQAVAI